MPRTIPEFIERLRNSAGAVNCPWRSMPFESLLEAAKYFPETEKPTLVKLYGAGVLFDSDAHAQRFISDRGLRQGAGTRLLVLKKGPNSYSGLYFPQPDLCAAPDAALTVEPPWFGASAGVGMQNGQILYYMDFILPPGEVMIDHSAFSPTGFPRDSMLPQRQLQFRDAILYFRTKSTAPRRSQWPSTIVFPS